MYSEWAAASRQATGGGSPPEWVPSLQAGNQSEQGLYLFLAPFGHGDIMTFHPTG
ncbi:MAG: hypothetical protein V7K97_01170 [Nostoc sp.]|uniref:hypothetical protein n=1 Tax=Nostoc sp. TaxID=1180 RepID=UPI002FF6463E